VVEPRWRDEFALLRIGLLLKHGQPVEALEIAGSVLARPDAHERTALGVFVMTVITLACRGRTDEAITAADHTLRQLGGLHADASLYADLLLAVRSFAQRLDGRLDKVERDGLARCSSCSSSVPTPACRVHAHARRGGARPGRGPKPPFVGCAKASRSSASKAVCLGLGSMGGRGASARSRRLRQQPGTSRWPKGCSPSWTGSSPQTSTSRPATWRGRG
jgi:hypothetical protein